MARAYLSIGSNLDDPAAQVRTAVEVLQMVGTVTAVSPFYRTKPWGTIPDQPEFVNAVVALETHLEPDALLARLKALERDAGRSETSARWGPRVLDLDILTYDDRVVDEPHLQIPHPRMNERAFVLVPLADINEAYAPERDALPQSERENVKSLSS